MVKIIHFRSFHFFNAISNFEKPFPATKTQRPKGFTKIIQQIFNTLCNLVSWCLGGIFNFLTYQSGLKVTV